MTLAEANMTEFEGYTGDCMWLAALAGLHALSPETYPMTPSELNGMVNAARERGQAGREGESTITEVATMMRNWYGAEIAIYPYHEPFGDDWQAILKEHAGTHPVLLELAHGEALPGDERGLHYHGICQLDSGVFADGDNPLAREGKLCEYSMEQVAAAQPCGMIVFLSATGEHPAAATTPEPSAPTREAPPASDAHRYTVAPGDTLSRIAAKLHLGNWYHDLYQPNMDTIENAARTHGHPAGSNSGNLIFPGTVLKY